MPAPCTQNPTCTETYGSITVSLPQDMIDKMNAIVAAKVGVASLDKLVESAFAFVSGRICPQIKTK